MTDEGSPVFRLPMTTSLCPGGRRGSCAAPPVASTPSPAARAGDSKTTLRWEEGHEMSVGDVEIYWRYLKICVTTLRRGIWKWCEDGERSWWTHGHVHDRTRGFCYDCGGCGNYVKTWEGLGKHIDMFHPQALLVMPGCKLEVGSIQFSKVLGGCRWIAGQEY